MSFEEADCTYIVAGDEMARLMSERYSDRKVIPFREDLSKGSCNGFAIDSDFIRERASFWGVSEDKYITKLKPIIEIDTTENFVLCFGEDECCLANMEFIIGYLKHKGYTLPLRINIVDEYNLTLIDEYCVCTSSEH